MAALLHAVEKATALGSAAVPGRINPMTNLAACFNHANPVPERSPVGCGQEWPRSCQRAGASNGSGARPSPAAFNPTTDRAPRFDHTNPQINIHENLKKLRIRTGFQPLLSLIWSTYLGRCPRLV